MYASFVGEKDITLIDAGTNNPVLGMEDVVTETENSIKRTTCEQAL